MLPITIKEAEYFDEEKQEFIHVNEQHLRLEHSLVSLSKWEAKWNKPFFSKEPKTREETIDYIRFMTITQNVNPLVYNFLSDKVIDEVQKYIDEPMTATTIKNRPKPGHKEIVTNEIIYYWMTCFNIPFDPCEKWHLNHLLCLIGVCNAKNEKPKKMSKNEQYSNNSALNAARRAKAHSRG